MDNLGEALAQLMGKLNLSKCVAVGEGAGADIVCRFAVRRMWGEDLGEYCCFPHLQMNYHQMVLGIVLIHCTSTTHGILEQIKEIVSEKFASKFFKYYFFNYIF
jgi:protein NDRG1